MRAFILFAAALPVQVAVHLSILPMVTAVIRRD